LIDLFTSSIYNLSLSSVIFLSLQKQQVSNKIGIKEHDFERKKDPVTTLRKVGIYFVMMKMDIKLT